MESDRQSGPRCASMSLIRYTLFSARIAIECGPRRSTLPLQAGMASLQRVASLPPPIILALPTNFSQRDSHAHWVAFSDVAAIDMRRIRAPSVLRDDVPATTLFFVHRLRVSTIDIVCENISAVSEALLS